PLRRRKTSLNPLKTKSKRTGWCAFLFGWSAIFQTFRYRRGSLTVGRLVAKMQPTSTLCRGALSPLASVPNGTMFSFACKQLCKHTLADKKKPSHK
ncbi:MAG: hypothetical protein J5815_01010, partial [Clostridia bacterium]|nr:hypothetical protein [Clostridia bacterium]